MLTSRALWLLTLCLGVASAQIGYPGGGYPGGYPPTYPGQSPYPGQTPYPGGRGAGIPVPSRGGTKKSEPSGSSTALPNFRGALKQMDDKSITLEMGDDRVLDFKRTSKTKFYKAGEELKAPGFQAGDQLSVEASQDPTGYLTAVNVYWERAASKESKKSDGTVDAWKDAPGATPPPKKSDEAAEPREISSERTPPPAKADPDDPGPPKLKRGGPADPARERAAGAPPERDGTPASDTANISRPVIRPIEEETRDVTRIRSTDDLIRRAADAALDFTAGLPAYVCQEVISRYQSQTQKPNWQAVDVVTSNLVYENGKEDYRDIAINGKAVKGKIEETGAWSTGEFGSVLIDLFSPATDAEFIYQREARISGMNTKLYDFAVKRENSHWSIHAASQGYVPAFKGSVWIDPQTSRVLRIEMQAVKFPEEFAFDHVESATDYQYIRLGDAKQYLLPVHSETLTCERGNNNCSRNVIDFRNYHKYSGESTVTFGAPK